MPNEIVTSRSFCALPFTKLILNGWGDVSMCCYQLMQLGSVLNNETSLLDLWNSPLAVSVRDETMSGRLHAVCKSWNTCPFLASRKYDHDFPTHRDFRYPTYLEICLPNTHCNIGGENPGDGSPACIMCCRNFEFKKQPPVTDALCEKARPVMQYLQWFCVLGIAEPFWKDAVFRVFDKVGFAAFKKQITFTTNTNGVCLVDRSVRRFFREVDRSSLSFSLDAATPPTYQKIRRIDGYELIVKNMKFFMKEREAHGGSQKHQVVIYNNINLVNVDEMVAMVEFASELAVDRLIMLPTHDQCGRVKMGDLLLNNRNLKIFRKNAEAARRRADDLRVNLHYSKPFDAVPPPVGQELQPAIDLYQIGS